MDWIKKLKEYAPDIATAVLTGGASLPQLALKAVSDVIGTEVTNEAELATVVEKATPEQMLKLTQANNSFKIRMTELSNELTASELGDLQNAREHHKQSKMPAIICGFLTVMMAMVVVGLFYETVPEANSKLLYFLLGNIVTAWLSSIAYFVGTTRSSSVKTSLMSMRK